MRRWLGVCCGVLSAVSMHAHAQVDLERYLKRDRFEVLKISPDGRHYAATVPMEDRTGLVVLRREDKAIVSSAVGVEKSAVSDFWWVANDRIVVAMAQSEGSEDALYLTGELHALGIDGGKVKTLFGRPGEAGNVVRIGMVDPVEMATMVDPLPDDPDHALVAIWKHVAEPSTRVVRMDVHSGQFETVATAPLRRAKFLVDARGRVRFARGLDSRNVSRLYYREHDEADWRLVHDQGEDNRVAVALGLAADDATAYVQVEKDDGPDAIEAWDMRSGARREVARDDAVDPYALLYAPDMRTPVGAQFMRDGVRMRMFDDAAPISRLYLGLERAFPGSAVTVTSFTRDGKVALVRVWNDRMLGEYYLYDVDKRHAAGAFVRMDWLPPEQVPATRAVTLRARDGLPLHGYLTLPLGSDGKGLPLVVSVHGGPYGIFDEWGFDTDTQVLAAAGYAVLRVNYRGSGNYGRRHLVTGAREWGGTMQDDVTDATRWAIADGIADPARICIHGASYGGYAALMGVAKEPDLYRCAVGYVGVYDMVALHDERSMAARWTRHWANEWMGERSDMRARSPNELAAQVRVPVFLAAGGKDFIAPVSHTRKMERALKRADVPVETLYIDTEGHGFTNDANRRRYYVQLLDFLSRHLGGARAAVP